MPTPRNERQLIARGRRFARAAKLSRQERLVAWTGVFFDDLDRLLGLEPAFPGHRSTPVTISRISPASRARRRSTSY